MEQSATCAVASGVRIMQEMEVCALGMVQWVNPNASLKDAPINLSMVAYVRGMVQRSSDAASKAAQIKSSKEEFVEGMEQKENALQMVVRIMLRGEDCASDMGQRSQAEVWVEFAECHVPQEPNAAVTQLKIRTRRP